MARYAIFLNENQMSLETWATQELAEKYLRKLIDSGKAPGGRYWIREQSEIGVSFGTPPTEERK